HLPRDDDAVDALHGQDRVALPQRAPRRRGRPGAPGLPTHDAETGHFLAATLAGAEALNVSRQGEATMKTRSLVLAAALALAGPADAKDKLSYAYLQDPVLEAVMWPLRNGKVTSDTLEIDGKGYQIPVLLQGTATMQWDVVMTAVMSVPRAKEQ